MLDESQNYGAILLSKNNNTKLIGNIPESRAKEYYEDNLNKNPSQKSIVDRLLGFLKRS